MASLGSLGVPVDPVDDADVLDFDYFGSTIRVDPSYTDADLIDVIETGNSLDASDPNAIVVVKDMLRSAVHDDDFDTFWRLARENRQDIEARMLVLNAIVDGVSARPTQRSGGSSAGPSTTRPSSEATSFERVLSRHEGRRDLQLLVTDAAGAQAGRRSA